MYCLHRSIRTQEDLLERVEQSFILFRQHGGKARRHRKRAREKTTRREEDDIVSALAKTGGGGGDDDHADDDMDMDVDDEHAARRPKVSIDIFEDVRDR